MKYKIKPHKKYPNMYHIRYPDGTLSEEFFNKTWAKEHCRRLAERERQDRYSLKGCIIEQRSSLVR